MPESEKPLLKGNSIPITNVGDYKDLFTFEVDPTRTLFVDTVSIEISDTTTEPLINVWLNGTPFLNNFPLINSITRFSFGRHWKVAKHKDVARIQIKIQQIGKMDVTMSATGYTAAVGGDIGGTVTANGIAIGYLAAYHNDTRIWVVQGNGAPLPAVNSAMVIVGGTGQGTSSSAQADMTAAAWVSGVEV